MAHSAISRPARFPLHTALFDYELPEANIAQRPAEARDGARMLVVEESSCQDAWVRHWPTLVPEGALVVLNETRVRKARLLGEKRGSGGRVELLLLGPSLTQQAGAEVWRAIGRASKPLREGTVLDFGALSGCIVAKREDGELEVAFSSPSGVEAELERVGHMPIPPYVRRDDDADDEERYQTVFARELGSVAAPTAGLHLTSAMLSALQARHCELGKVTLHVGLGTFRPVSVDDLDQHVMHRERYEVSPLLADQIAAARQRNAPVVAVGTTVVRALESAALAEAPGLVRPTSEETQLLIQPGVKFQVVDALLTNFHQPRSTLLALVSAFIGLSRLHSAYREALSRGYRFLSYGDAMWLPRRFE